MQKNSFLNSSSFGHYKLSSSYPSIKPLSKELPYEGFFNFGSCNSFTRSWGSSQSAKSNEFLRGETQSNSDLQPLTWLQKQSIINIIPLDAEEEIHSDSFLPGHDAVLDPQLCCPREEVETQENSNVQDYVRFQAQRSNISHQRLALRQHNSFCPDATHNYSYKVNGHTKPNLSYTQLIFMAIETCKDRAMTVNDIYQWCEVNYPYYKHIGPAWKNSLRHNLSINKSFRRMPRDGQMTTGKSELLTNEDIIMEDMVSRDNKQGGPGRGAYWVVDDKERKNLLESIYRVQQTVPLSDRNEQHIDPSFSLVVNPPKTGPLLCIDGRFTDASTYLQSRRSDDESTTENKPVILSPLPSEVAPVISEGTPETEYAAMMRGLTNDKSPEVVADASVKLSLSCNSQVSKPENHDSTDSSKPKLKNRRKSCHEKVRSYLEHESSSKDDDSATSPGNNKEVTSSHNMTSVNVVVAPHFDHIYARYQQFLPPAIASDMDKTAFTNQQDCDSNPDAEFLKNGYRDEEEESEEENDMKSEIKTEKVDGDEIHIENQKSDVNKISTERLNASNVAFATRRKIKRAISKIIQPNMKRARIALPPHVEVKKEMVEPNESVCKDSDGYNTDSTMPMTARNLRRSSRVLMKRRFTSKRTSKFAINNVFTNDRLNRSKRKRSRPLRIDESHELSAIRFLANLERRHQQLRNIDNLYNLNNFLNVTESSSSVQKGLPHIVPCDLIDLSSIP